MTGFKDAVTEAKSRMEELANGADKLDNKNLRDILLLGVARFDQALLHPDIDRVDANEDQRNTQFRDDANLNSGGNALFAAGDPGASLQNEEAMRRVAFGASKPMVAGGDPFNPGDTPFPGADPAAKHPDDPVFIKPNADFKDPDAVNLNADGTLKTAPNTAGASDNRDGDKK